MKILDHGTFLSFIECTMSFIDLYDVIKATANMR